MIAHVRASRPSTARKTAPDDGRTTPPVQVRVARPTATCLLIEVCGELDLPGCAHLHEVLAARLSSAAEALVLDLSQLSFIGVPGLELLDRTRRLASRRGITLRLVTGPRCLRRALTAAGMSETFACSTTPDKALAKINENASRLTEATR